MNSLFKAAHADPLLAPQHFKLSGSVMSGSVAPHLDFIGGLMSALVLLSDYKMKKKKDHEAKRESEIPVTLAFMRELRAEMLSGFSQINAQLKQVNARIDQVDAKVDQAVAEMKTTNHQTKLLVEEQALRNRQAYDGYAITYGAIQDLKNRIKPDCLED